MYDTATYGTLSEDESLVTSASHLSAMAKVANPPAQVAAICGLPGSGKSTAARVLREALGWPLITTELVRLELYPELAPSQADDDFTPEELKATYAALSARTSKLLARYSRVIVDGVFRTLEQRNALTAVARSGGTEVTWILLTCDPAIARHRLITRNQFAASGPAGPKAYQKISGEFDPLPDPAIRIDTTRLGPIDVASTILRVLDSVGSAS